MEGYDNLTPNEILQELIRYKEKGFSWFNQEIYGEDININSPDHNYSDKGIRMIIGGDFKLEFNNKRHLEILKVLDLYYLLDAEDSFDFMKSDNISLLDNL